MFLNGNVHGFWATAPLVSNEFKHLFTRMIAVDPANRISLEDIINHEWTMRDDLPSDEEI